MRSLLAMVLACCMSFLTVAVGAAAEEGSRVLGLLKAYPDFLDRIVGNDLVWKDGTRMSIDDKKGAKDFETLLEKPDIKDQFVMLYPLGPLAAPPQPNFDPGRVRYMPLFDKMYGDCTKGETVPKLVEITWLPKKNGEKLKITGVNGVAERLAAVSRELDDLSDEFVNFLKPTSGTYNCRVIAGTDRLSAHGHGIAIDINSDQSDYWMWTKPDANGLYPYRNRVPYQIAEIFEKHGFIWGGKWYHYDTMHFEYRPELFIKTN